MNKTWQDTEKDFELRIATLGKKAFLHRVTDTKEANRGKKTNKVKIKAQPSDYLLTYEGKMRYAEVKHCSNKTSFPFSNLTISQFNAMTRQRAAGGLYSVFVYNSNTDTWYNISGDRILFCLELKEKSIKWKEIEHLKWIQPQYI